MIVNNMNNFVQPIMCCEIMEGIPHKKKITPPELEKVKTHEEKKKKEVVTEKIDIYYFDHGNSAQV